MAAERKARVGRAHTFVWEAPDALVGAPVLTLSGQSIELSPLRAAVAVTETSTDLCTLTAADATLAGSKGTAGRYGRAYLITEGEGVFPVHVAAIDDGEITLAEPLPHAIETEASLQWATWSTVLPQDITATEARNLRFDVAFEIVRGEDIFAEAGQAETGLFHVVDVPFATGLTHEAFLAVFPDLRAMLSRGQTDLGPTLRFAEDMLIGRLRKLLAPRGLTEDDLKTGQALRPAHAHLVAARIVEAQDQARAESLRAFAWELADEALRAVWLDEDKDGEASAAEAPAPVTGPRAVLPAWSDTSTVERRFYVGRPH